VVDSEGQPIAHALVAREDSQHISDFLQTAKAWFPSIVDAIFIVDKDHAEIRAISEVFPDSRIHLCRFHIIRAFMEEMKQQNLNNDRDLYQVIFCIKHDLQY